LEWGIPNTLIVQAAMPHGLNCPEDFVQVGSGTHQAEKASLHLTVVALAVMISGSHPEHRMSGLIIAVTQGRNEVTWSSQSPVDLTSLVF
jgi:hypothetical protein